ncbi:MAG TPA: homocysteine biosynthesis protein [Clostridia bacterium]|nr:homocysteine biosynthesis protein [Clostridia bacterium]
MAVKKTYDEINQKIKEGNAVIVTADEVLDIVAEKGIREAAKHVDVVTTATFGPMCSTGAFINFGHADPPIRMTNVLLNDVPAYAGLAAVDAYIGATETSISKGIGYGGAHVICDLIDRKEIRLKASSPGTDCYPRKNIETWINLDDVNEAYLYNPRNAYQNYSAAINTSDSPLYTYMGILKPAMGNVHYCTSGQLSPLLNDPYYRTIGIGTRIFLAGAQGFVSWMGTQFSSGRKRNENGLPNAPGGTLAVSGDLRKMTTDFLKPAVFKNYGISMFVGIGVPIPILDEEMMSCVSVSDKDIFTSIEDYSFKRRDKASLGTVSYEELRSGHIKLGGKKIPTAPITSLHKSKQIAKLLKEQIGKGEFEITRPVQRFPLDNTLKSLEIKSKGEK